MPRRPAIDIALDAVERPGITSLLSAGPLPKDLKCLLCIAAEGSWRGPSTDHVYERHSPEAVRSASTAFLSAVLFARQTDPYRVLGLQPGASLSEVREHKRLLLKWLHPDRNPEASAREHFSRVVEAAETIESGRSHLFSQPATGPKLPLEQGGSGSPGIGPRQAPALQQLARAARQSASRLTPRLVRAAKVSSSGIAILLFSLLAWRFLMNEPIGVSLERYSRLAEGMISWR